MKLNVNYFNNINDLVKRIRLTMSMNCYFVTINTIKYTNDNYIRKMCTDFIKKCLLQKWSTVGAVLSIIVMLVIMFTGSLFLWRSYNVLESAIYAAVNRPMWACSLTLFILCCSLGHVRKYITRTYIFLVSKNNWP